MIVKVDLDPKLVWAISEAAEAQQMTTSQFVARALSGSEKRERHSTSPPLKWVREMRSLGMTNRVIARHLGVTERYLLQMLEQLEPNKK